MNGRVPEWKTCSACGKAKPIEEFRWNNRANWRRQNKCVGCVDRVILAPYKTRFPERTAAQRKVKAAIVRGDLIRRPCERCGKPNAHAHHEDYSKPLDVTWLCAWHHKMRHEEINQANASVDQKIIDTLRAYNISAALRQHGYKITSDGVWKLRRRGIPPEYMPIIRSLAQRLRKTLPEESAA